MLLFHLGVKIPSKFLSEDSKSEIKEKMVNIFDNLCLGVGDYQTIAEKTTANQMIYTRFEQGLNKRIFNNPKCLSV